MKNRPLVVGLVLLVLPLILAVPSPADETADTVALREIYSSFVQAFDHRDPSPILGRVSVDFELLLANGQKMGRQEYEERLRSVIAHVTRTTIEVDHVAFAPDQAITLTTERQTCELPVGQGQTVVLHVTGKARTWWTRTPEGWQMKQAQLLETRTEE